MIDTATISLGTASSNANDRNAEKSTGRGRIERVIGSVLQGKAQLQKNGTFFFQRLARKIILRGFWERFPSKIADPVMFR